MVYYTLLKEKLIYSINPLCFFREMGNPDDKDISKTIENFNSLYNYDNMFDLSEVRRRLRKGDKFFIFYYDGDVCGHSWFSRHPEKMGFLSEKALPGGSIYCYNVFVDKRIHNKLKVDSCEQLSSVCQYMFAEGYERIHLYTDDWNTNAMSFFERIGFEEDDWTKNMF